MRRKDQQRRRKGGFGAFSQKRKKGSKTKRCIDDEPKKNTKGAVRDAKQERSRGKRKKNTHADLGMKKKNRSCVPKTLAECDGQTLANLQEEVELLGKDGMIKTAETKTPYHIGAGQLAG